MSPELLWEATLQITNDMGEDAKALRVLLYMLLLSVEQKPTLRHWLQCYRKLCRWLILPSGRQLPEAEKSRPLFAFIFDTGANMNNLLPVFQAARKRGWNPGALMGDRVVADLPEDGGGCVNVRQVMAATTGCERLLAIGQAWKQYKALFAGFGCVNPDLAKVIRRFKTYVVTELSLLIASRHGLRRLYSAWRPSCVVSTTEYWPFDHAVFSEARRMDIPGFVVQHGLTAVFWWPSITNRVIIWGQSFYDELIKLGAPPERLAVCGMPAADQLFARYQTGRVVPSTRNSPFYVIVSQTHARGVSPELFAKYGCLMKEIMAATPTVRWFVKLHPSEDESFYQKLGVLHFRNVSILPKSTTLEDAVTGACAACTLYSTAGLEAMMMQVPVIVFDLEPIIRQFAWWPRSGGGTYISTTEKMLDFARNVASDDGFRNGLINKQNSFLSKTFANPGQAAEAALTIIEEVISSLVKENHDRHC